MRCFRNLLIPAAVLGACVATMAQMPTYNLGRAPTPEEIRAWSTEILVEGKDLPPGSGTSKQGAQIYAQKCATCHGKTGTRLPPYNFVALVGEGPLKPRDINPNKTLGNYYPFATTLYEHINRTMPMFQEGSLRPDEVYALTAFLLYRNGIVKEDDVLDAKTLPKIQMPNRNGFVPAWPKYKPREKKLYGQYP